MAAALPAVTCPEPAGSDPQGVADPRAEHIAVYALRLREALCALNAVSAQMVGALDRWDGRDLVALAPALDVAVREAGDAAACLSGVVYSERVA